MSIRKQTLGFGFAILALVALSAGGATAQTAPRPAKSVKPDAPKLGVHKNPRASSFAGQLLSSLKLIRAGKFDKWIATRCHKTKTCYNLNSIRSFKRYNLPALKRRLNGKHSCIGAGNTIEVTRIRSYGATMRVYIRCGKTSMPRPFRVVYVGKVLKHLRI